MVVNQLLFTEEKDPPTILVGPVKQLDERNVLILDMILMYSINLTFIEFVKLLIETTRSTKSNPLTPSRSHKLIIVVASLSYKS